MSTHSDCPELSVLSQFFDREITEAEEPQINQHLQSCPRCCARIEQLRRAENMMKAALTKVPAQILTQTLSAECLSPELISAHVHHLLPIGEQERAERHLQTCDACLDEVREAVRTAMVLASSGRELTPPALKAKVASLWKPSPENKQIVAFSRLVIQIAKKGLSLLEQHLIPPFLEVQEMLASAPAYRAEERSSTLNLRIKTDRSEIRVTSVQEGDGVTLKLTLLGAQDEVLPGRRVFLRHQGQSIFSAKTDHEGVLRTPHLEPGIYEIACPGTNAAFELELRS